ncbi:hypothetical protein FHS22_000090 [Planomonospora venezuelensis]|uniref:Uncharacterized protein n=1 Tax=Planomonospora venezuelensis TaxID=1999 RepID=A0A841CQZ9_PLAVE|nr:hypothetical protein [Planomonospora venezuelensis]
MGALVVSDYTTARASGASCSTSGDPMTSNQDGENGT